MPFDAVVGSSSVSFFNAPRRTHKPCVLKMRLLASLVLALAATHNAVMTASAAECDVAQQALVQTLDAQVLAGCPNVTDVASASSETVCISSGCVELVGSLIGQYPDCSVNGYDPKVVFGGAIAACSGGLVDDGGSGATASSSSTTGTITGSASSVGDTTGVGDLEGGDVDAGDGGDDTPAVGDGDASEGGSDSASGSGSSGAAASLAISSAVAMAVVILNFAM